MKKILLATLFLHSSMLLFSDEITPQFEDNDASTYFSNEELELNHAITLIENELYEQEENRYPQQISPLITNAETINQNGVESNYNNLLSSIDFNNENVKYSSYKEALVTLKEEGKIIMLELFQDDCYFCDRMDQETFTEKNVIQTLNDNFITVKLNIHKDNLPLKISDMTPSFIFLRGEEDIITTAYGMKKPDDFLKILNNVIELK